MWARYRNCKNLTHIACTPELQICTFSLSAILFAEIKLRTMSHVRFGRKHVSASLPVIPEETPDELKQLEKLEKLDEPDELGSIASESGADDAVDIFFEEGDSVLDWVYVKEREEFLGHERVARWSNKLVCKQYRLF